MGSYRDHQGRLWRIGSHKYRAIPFRPSTEGALCETSIATAHAHSPSIASSKLRCIQTQNRLHTSRLGANGGCMSTSTTLAASPNHWEAKVMIVSEGDVKVGEI